MKTQRDLFHGDVPGHRNTDTSFDAAVSMKPHRPHIQRCILDALEVRPMTTYELVDHLGITKDALQPRTSELQEQRIIIDSGGRRRGPTGRKGIVWKVADRLPTETETPQ